MTVRFAIGLLAMGGSPIFVGARYSLPDVAPPPQFGLSASDCGVCHPTEFEEWSGSRHRSSWDNPLLATSYAREPLQWCVDCHAPLPEQKAAIIAGRLGDLASEGINCDVCHVRGGNVLSAQPPTARGLAAHPMQEEPELRRSEFCGNCHQFNFPVERRDPVRYSSHPMQNTLSEWAASPNGLHTCQECHMALGGHRMAGGHDVDLLRKTLSVRVVRDLDGWMKVRVEARGAGHRVPTGDPFRRLRVDLLANAPIDVVVDSVELGRRITPTGTSWMIAQDRTVPAGPEPVTEIQFRPRSPAANWRVLYEYAAPSTEPALAPEDREVELARGAIKTNGTR
jgi:hypothetical protein